MCLKKATYWLATYANLYPEKLAQLPDLTAVLIIHQTPGLSGPKAAAGVAAA